MKMSDVFELPVTVDSDNDIKVADWGFFFASEDISEQQAHAAAHAINNHDALVGLLSELLYDDSISIYLSAIESTGPDYPDLEEWEQRARKLLDATR